MNQWHWRVREPLFWLALSLAVIVLALSGCHFYRVQGFPHHWHGGRR